jgi:hypothetical protein
MIFDSQSLRDSLSDFSSEGWPIVTLEILGSPNLGIVSLINTLVTSWAFSEEQGNTSTGSGRYLYWYLSTFTGAI